MQDSGGKLREDGRWKMGNARWKMENVAKPLYGRKCKRVNKKQVDKQTKV
jgi:hypothetical protein